MGGDENSTLRGSCLALDCRLDLESVVARGPYEAWGRSDILRIEALKCCRTVIREDESFDRQGAGAVAFRNDSIVDVQQIESDFALLKRCKDGLRCL